MRTHAALSLDLNADNTITAPTPTSTLTPTPTTTARTDGGTTTDATAGGTVLVGDAGVLQRIVRGAAGVYMLPASPLYPGGRVMQAEVRKPHDTDRVLCRNHALVRASGTSDQQLGPLPLQGDWRGATRPVPPHHLNVYPRSCAVSCCTPAPLRWR